MRFRRRTTDDHQGSPPLARDWLGYGRVEQEVAGSSAGYETPAGLHQTAERHGELYGPAQVPAKEALAETAAPISRIKGAAKLRAAVVRMRSLNARSPARQRIETLPARQAAAAVHERHVAERLALLEAKPALIEKLIKTAGEEVASLRSALATLPILERASLVTIAGVAAIGAAAFAYDGVVLAPALKHAGFGLQGPMLLGASIMTPVALVAVCLLLGLVWGGIIRHLTERQQLRMLVITLAIGALALLATIVLLTLFRAGITAVHNQPGGSQVHHKRHYVIPWWFGPFQFAGALAASGAVALHAASEKGRELRTRLAEATGRVSAFEDERRGVERQTERTRGELETAALAVHEVERDAKAAEIEVRTFEETLEAELAAEEALEMSAVGAYRAMFTYIQKIYANGDVWRVALPTVPRRFSRVFTPPPQEAKQYEHAATDSNGHKDI